MGLNISGGRGHTEAKNKTAARIGWSRVGVPRALKNGVNKERPLQIGLPPNYPKRVYIERCHQ
jgi:hypothetical protein